MKSLIPPDMGLIVLRLSFFNDGFGIKEPTKVDMLLLCFVLFLVDKN